jgi:hypothetical protein
VHDENMVAADALERHEDWSNAFGRCIQQAPDKTSLLTELPLP